MNRAKWLRTRRRLAEQGNVRALSAALGDLITAPVRPATAHTPTRERPAHRVGAVKSIF